MQRFSGPLFLVGSPRSGTKLLRDLLNRNSLVSLCNPESHFIPYLFGKFGDDPAVFDVDLDQFFADFDETPFQIYSRSMGRPVMTRADFDKLGKACSWSDAFEIVLRYYGDGGSASDGIWGDKTPSYVMDMDLLKQIFPTARFLHIIRDPRDVAVSAHKAWGHDMLRVATKWARDIQVAQKTSADLGKDYMAVHYEDLLADPERAMRRISSFIDRPYEAVMISLSVPSENIGGAKGKTFIDSSNHGKYRQQLSPRRQKRIEEIVHRAIEATPYHPEYAIQHRPLSQRRLAWLAVMDGSRSLRHRIRGKGLVDGLRITIGSLLQKRHFPPKA